MFGNSAVRLAFRSLQVFSVSEKCYKFTDAMKKMQRYKQSLLR